MHTPREQYEFKKKIRELSEIENNPWKNTKGEEPIKNSMADREKGRARVQQAMGKGFGGSERY